MKLANWACTLALVGVAVTTSAACSSASQVRQVYMALDTNGDRPRDIFYTDTKQISCDVVWVGRSLDTTVEGQIIQTATETSFGSDTLQACPQAGCALMGANEQAGSEGTSTISFTWTAQSPNGGGTAPFPRGKFECRVFVNGDFAGSAGFEVQYPPDGCPAASAAFDGAACAGWVKPGSTCRDAADFTKTCVCGGASWSCQ